MRTYNIQLSRLGTIFFLLLSLAVFSQSNTLILDDPETGNQRHEACKQIQMLPGYSYKAQQGYSMYAYINPDLICDVDYNSGFAGGGNTGDLNTTLEVGTTPGSFAISATGGATYAIPLVSPPGTNGIMPSLSIQYNSQGGDGLLGKGWAMAGLSSISRVQQTFYHDNGNIFPVTLTNNDRFTLDGARLIAISGANGLDGTQYATEAETFVKVTSLGQVGNGPLTFTVQTKEGLTMEYGSTDDSRIEASGKSTVLTWLLSKVSDNRGNYIRIYYTENNGSGEFRPDRIVYTGNDALGLSPYNEIKFVYGNRKDKQRAYISGAIVNQNVVLTEVKMYVESILTHTYEFKYVYSMASHLSEVIEKDKDGKQFNPIRIAWGNEIPPNIVPGLSRASFFDDKVSNLQPIDYNGDGLSDILQTGSFGWFLYRNDWLTKNTFTQVQNGTINGQTLFPALGNQNIVNVDLDGNGFEDMLIYAGTNYNYLGQEIGDAIFYPYFSNGTSLNQGREFWANRGDAKYLLGDFDGDGATDLFLFYYDADNWEVFSFKKNKLFYGHYDYGNIELSFSTVDFNGDGKHEIMYTYDAAGIYNVLELNPQGQLDSWGASSDYPAVDYSILSPGDFNGDGRTDLLTWHPNSGWQIGYRNGSGFHVVQAPLENHGSPYGEYEYFVSDYNGDGKHDILEKSKNVNQYNWPRLNTFYSNGMAFEQYDVTLDCNCTMTARFSSYLGDYDGDGNKDFLYRDVNSMTQTPAYIVNFLAYERDIHRVTKISNGFNYETKIEYSTLPRLAKLYNEYQMGTGGGYPTIDFQQAVPVVRSYSYSNGIANSTNSSKFAYSGAKLNLQGKGFLGFSKLTTTDVTAEIKIENEYKFNSFLHQIPYRTISTNLQNNNQINFKEYEFTLNSLGGKRYYSYLSKLEDVDVLHGVANTYTYHQDEYGNIDVAGVTNAAITTSTINQYEKKGAWMPSRLTSTQTTITRVGESAYTRSSSITNNDFGQPDIITQDIGLVTDYEYYDLGNVKEVVISGPDIPSNKTTNVYDSKGRFIIKQTNALGHVEEMTYDNAYGNVLSSKDPNQLVTKYVYDGFGRLIKSIPPTNQEITIQRHWDLNNSDLSNSISKVETQQAGIPPSIDYFDILGRSLRSQTVGFDGKIINTDKEYNNQGQLTRVSEPYFNGNTPLYTTYMYETFKRIQTINSASGTKVDYSYNLNTTEISTTTNNGTQTNIRTLDAAGQLISASDDAGTLSYKYHSCGNPREITIPGSTKKVEMTYDNFGRQISLNDPDAGIINYTYDVLGQILTQRDGKGSYTMTYDALGRMLTKKEAGGENTLYRYDNKSKGIGMLGSVIDALNGINQEYTYDNFSRLISEKEIISGTTYVHSYSYDNLDRVTEVTYPGGFKIKQSYNPNGYLEKIIKASDNKLIWQCLDMTERMQTLSANQGNGGSYTKTYSELGFLTNITAIEKYNNIPQTAMDWSFDFDPTNGNLLSRSNNLYGLTESFTYDKLDRLSVHNIHGMGYMVTYQPNGNIDYKPDAGFFHYDASRPHALVKIKPYTENVSTETQDITYTPFSSVSLIKQGEDELSFTYGTDHQRRKSVQRYNGNIERTIIYKGNYEKISNAEGSYQLSYISSPDGLVAIHVVPPSGGAGNLYYVHTDHLGSIISLFDENGVVTHEQNFDAWGRERNPYEWSYNSNTSEAPSWLIRGYTGHEHHKQFGIINMNGRLYDPVVGRMLSTDNFVQGIANTQAYNRYSYAFNNPLKYTDPSGEIAVIPAMMIAAFANAVIIGWSGGTPEQMIKGAAVGATSAGVGSTIASGGGAFANTASIIASSTINSNGMSTVLGGGDVSTSFGAFSYNWTQDEWGYLGKKGNSVMENIGYGFGALANIQDGVAGFHGTDMNAISRPKLFGHSEAQGYYQGKPILVSVGPAEQISSARNPLKWEWEYVKRSLKFNSVRGENESYIMANQPRVVTRLNNVNGKLLSTMTDRLNNGRNLLDTGPLKYGLLKGCVNYTARAYFLSGVINVNALLPITAPVLLNFELAVRQVGFIVSPLLTE